MKALGLLFCLFMLSPTLAGDNIRSIPKTPAVVKDLVYARTFSLTKGYRHDGRKGQPMIDTGVIVVLRVNPKLVVPTNAPSPILYAGDRILHILNQGDQSGHVIGIIQGLFNFVQEPIWFGRPRVPGQAIPKTIKSIRVLANTNIKPFSMDKIERATRAPLQAPDLTSLLRGEIAELVLKYSPQESDLARKWRLPVAKTKPNPARPAVYESKGRLK